MMEHAIEEFGRQAAASGAIADAAGKATIGGGTVATAYSVFGSDHMLTLIGIICTVGTFIITWVYKRREYKLNEKKLEMEYKMRILAEQRRQQLTDAQIHALREGHAVTVPCETNTTQGAPL